MSALAILTKCPLAKCPLAKCRLAKCPLAKCPDTIFGDLSLPVGLHMEASPADAEDGFQKVPLPNPTCMLLSLTQCSPLTFLAVGHRGRLTPKYVSPDGPLSALILY